MTAPPSQLRELKRFFVDEGARWAVIQGDNRQVLDELLREQLQVDHLISDPPYSDHVHAKQRRVMAKGKGGRKSKRRASGKGFYRAIGVAPLGFDALSPELRARCAAAFGRLVRRWALVFSDAESCHLWRAELTNHGLRHVREGAWVKLCAQPQLSGDRPGVGYEAIQISHARGNCRWNGGGLPAVWVHPIATDRNSRGERLHTTQKPLELMMELVAQFTAPGEIIFDPFCGSATTGVACLRLGRRFLGVEQDAAYASIARERLAAEAQCIDVVDARAGQLSLLAGVA